MYTSNPLEGMSNGMTPAVSFDETAPGRSWVPNSPLSGRTSSTPPPRPSSMHRNLSNHKKLSSLTKSSSILAQLGSLEAGEGSTGQRQALPDPQVVADCTVEPEIHPSQSAEHDHDHDDHSTHFTHLLKEHSQETAPNGRAWREYIFALSEGLVILFYGLFVTFDPLAQPGGPSTPSTIAAFQGLYPFYQDVHVMIFIGFGFLMTFLKTHRWGALAFNFAMSIWALQWGLLSSGFWNQVIPGGSGGGWQKIELNLTSLINGDFDAAAAMITFGALLGRCTLAQLAALIFLEMLLCGLNEAICLQYFKASDLGGSIVLHTFGAYFGLAASYFFHARRASKTKPTASYDSQAVAVVGTLFLFVFWPSFNAALATGAAQQRAVLNTVLSIGGGCIGAICAAQILLARLDMEVVLNATLAGGVVMGSACDIIAAPWAAIFIGFCAGALSTVGFRVIGPFLSRKINLQDTCGVHSLHGMPGVLGAIVSAIAVALAPGQSFPANYFPVVAAGGTLSGQVAAQFYALLTTLGIAVVGGLAAGFCCSLPIFQQVATLHHDKDHFTEVCVE